MSDRDRWRALLDDYDPVPGLVAHGVMSDPDDHDPESCDADCCSRIHDPLCPFDATDLSGECRCTLIREARAEQDKKWAKRAAKDARRVLKARKAQETAVMMVKADCERRLDEARAEADAEIEMWAEAADRQQARATDAERSEAWRWAQAELMSMKLVAVIAQMDERIERYVRHINRQAGQINEAWAEYDAAGVEVADLTSRLREAEDCISALRKARDAARDEVSALRMQALLHEYDPYPGLVARGVVPEPGEEETP